MLLKTYCARNLRLLKQVLIRQTAKQDRTSALVANLVEDFHNVPATLKQIQETLNAHTTALDTIVKNTNNWQTEMITMRGQIERQEKAIKLLAEKLNLDVENILQEPLKNSFRPAISEFRPSGQKNFSAYPPDKHQNLFCPAASKF